MATRTSKHLPDFGGKRVTVMGLGLLGGGLAATRFFAECGATVTATDLRSEKQLLSSINKLHDLDIAYTLGEHREEDFVNADVIVVNPGVKEDSPFLVLASKKGVALETEVNLFFKLCPARILGVTGSVGKTTTTSMIGHVLKSSGRKTWVGGNIGQSLLPQIREIEPGDTVVLELSSFQLRRLDWIKVAPAISVVTNFHPNHLDNHPTIEDYARCKKHIISNQTAGDIAVLNADDPVIRQWSNDCPGRVQYFGLRNESLEGAFLSDKELVLRLGKQEQRICSVSDLQVPGEHNVANALTCASACAAAGISPKKIGKALSTFEGVEHRLEFIGEWCGVRYFNDSKATTPSSTIRALESFDRRVILIAGGSSKDLTYNDFAKVAARKTRAIFLIGETAGQIASAVNSLRTEHLPLVKTFPSLETAVEASYRTAKRGDIVLLSPTTASFDMFDNFEDRGRQFKKCVIEINSCGVN